MNQRIQQQLGAAPKGRWDYDYDYSMSWGALTPAQLAAELRKQAAASAGAQRRHRFTRPPRRLLRRRRRPGDPGFDPSTDYIATSSEMSAEPTAMTAPGSDGRNTLVLFGIVIASLLGLGAVAYLAKGKKRRKSGQG